MKALFNSVVDLFQQEQLNKVLIDNKILIVKEKAQRILIRKKLEVKKSSWGVIRKVSKSDIGNQSNRVKFKKSVSS